MRNGVNNNSCNQQCIVANRPDSGGTVPTINPASFSEYLSNLLLFVSYMAGLNVIVNHCMSLAFLLSIYYHCSDVNEI